MRPYLALLYARMRMLLQYRAAALAGFATQLFWGGIRVMIFDAFYRSTQVQQPLTYEQTVTYLWLIQAMLLLIPWGVDGELRQMILSGNVAYELARPVDLYWLWFTRSMAARISPVLLRATPLFIIAGAFFGLQPPASWASAGVWLVAMLAAVILSSAIGTLMAISLMWTVGGDGIVRLVGTLTSMLSGSVVPLPFFPAWSQPILAALPFGGLMDVPFRIYVGSIAPGDALIHLVRQLAWSAALIFFGRWLLARGTRHLVIQGG